MKEYLTVNLEQGYPVVAEGIAMLHQVLQDARLRKYAAVKIIHGYGSSGRGGKLRTGLRKELNAMQQQGAIAGFVKGEDFSIFEPHVQKLLLCCANLRTDADLERGNGGITIVLMKE